MEAYEVLLKNDDGSYKNQTASNALNLLLIRAWQLIRRDNYDICSKVKAEMMSGSRMFEPKNIDPDYNIFFMHAVEEYNKLSSTDKRMVDTCLREIVGGYIDRIHDAEVVYTVPNEYTYGVNNSQLCDIIDEYIAFKVRLNDIPEDVSEEVERLANLSDEEFEAEIEKSENNEDYNEDYDIPDERLYEE